jgi:hypothetical protein
MAQKTQKSGFALQYGQRKRPRLCKDCPVPKPCKANTEAVSENTPYRYGAFALYTSLGFGVNPKPYSKAHSEFIQYCI